MKTTLHFRIFIVTVMMIAISCSEPEIAPTGPKKGLPPVPTNEYYTSVTTWTAAGDGTFIGLVSTMLPIDLSKAAVFAVVHGQRISMTGQSKASNLPDMIDGYISASVQNNVLLLNFAGKTAESKPPFPLEVILVY
jgi:hypothetical protein